MDYETIILEKKEFVATVTFNRPDKLNAVNTQMRRELGDVFGRLDEDDETRVIIITGQGRGFCTGADTTELFQSRKDKEEQGMRDDVIRSRKKEHPLVLAHIRKPTIAAINGLAVGGGCTMSLNCDIRIASEAARFMLPFTRLGGSPELGSTYFLPRIVGIAKACELMFTSRMIDAREAKEIGLVNQVVPAEELARASWEMASSIAKLSPLSVQACKRALYQGLDDNLAAQLQFEDFAQNYLRGTEDLREATRAFREKRDGVFKGK